MWEILMFAGYTVDITKANVRVDAKAQELCKIGFESYNLLMRRGNKDRKAGNIQKGRELHWSAGNMLESAVGWMLGLKCKPATPDRLGEQQTIEKVERHQWIHAIETDDITAWDFTSPAQRVDIKACKASQYGGHIFVEEHSKGVATGWTKDKRTGDFLLYVDTDTGNAWLLSTQKLLGVCSRAGKPKSGGDDNGASGYVIGLTTLAEWGVISATWLFPTYGTSDAVY